MTKNKVKAVTPSVAVLPPASRVAVDKLTPHPDNYNQHPARQVSELARALGQFGQTKPLIVWRGQILAGEGLWRAARKLGLKELEARDATAVWSAEQALAYLVSDNETARLSDPDYDQLLELVRRSGEAGVEVPGLDAELVAALAAEAERPDGSEGEEEEVLEGGVGAEATARVRDVPDTVWPTDNEQGIPLLDPALAADALDLPVVLWATGLGVSLKAAHMRGTWHFYTEDWRFRALWTNPTPVTNSGCINVVEPNFSIYANMPYACALWQVYRKRWLARYWQSFGLRVLVDLNVPPAYADLNCLGVPAGWDAFCTRGASEHLDELAAERDRALQIAGKAAGLLFVVYGGGRAVKDWCGQVGVLWVPEDRDVAGGRALAREGQAALLEASAQRVVEKQAAAAPPAPNGKLPPPVKPDRKRKVLHG